MSERVPISRSFSTGFVPSAQNKAERRCIMHTQRRGVYGEKPAVWTESNCSKRKINLACARARLARWSVTEFFSNIARGLFVHLRSGVHARARIEIYRWHYSMAGEREYGGRAREGECRENLDRAIYTHTPEWGNRNFWSPGERMTLRCSVLGVLMGLGNGEKWRVKIAFGVVPGNF